MHLMLSRLVAVFVVVALAGCGASSAVSRPSITGGDANGIVIRVVDGDTIVVALPRKHNESVRLIGIDTPESVKPNTSVQCFALEASARTKALLPPHTPVRLVRDAEARDRYGRLLAYVYRSTDGLF